MRLNIAKHYLRPRLRTHEGAPAVAISPEEALRRAVLSCMLWEGEFYEDGVQIAARIRELVPQVEPQRKSRPWPSKLCERMKLRHAPLLAGARNGARLTHLIVAWWRRPLRLA